MDSKRVPHSPTTPSCRALFSVTSTKSHMYASKETHFLALTKRCPFAATHLSPI